MRRPAKKRKKEQPHNQRDLAEYWDIKIVDEQPRGPTQTTLTMWSRTLSRSQEPKTSNCVLLDDSRHSLSAPQPLCTRQSPQPVSSSPIVLDEVVELSDSDVEEVKPKQMRYESSPVMLNASSPTVQRFNAAMQTVLVDCTQPLDGEDSLPSSPIPAGRVVGAQEPGGEGVAAALEAIPETPSQSPDLSDQLPELANIPPLAELHSDPISEFRSEENSLEQHGNSDPLASITQWYHDNLEQPGDSAEPSHGSQHSEDAHASGSESPLEGFCSLQNASQMDASERDLYYNQFQPTRSNTAPHAQPQPAPFTSAAAGRRWAGSGRLAASHSAPVRPVVLSSSAQHGRRSRQQQAAGFTVCNHYAADPFLDVEASLNWEGGGASRFG
ncbi:hypothetical protein EC988_004934 [Linderina pennispora]|nr:hypothetical protein EC988_004934 [Linderina pennispora]